MELEQYSDLEFEQVLDLFCSYPSIRKQFHWKELDSSAQYCFNLLCNAIRKKYPNSPLHSEESYRGQGKWNDDMIECLIKTTPQITRKIIDLIKVFYNQNHTITNHQCLDRVNAVLKREGRKATKYGNVRQKLYKLKKSCK